MTKIKHNKMGGGKGGTAGPNKQNFPKKLQKYRKGSKKLRPKHRKTIKIAPVFKKKCNSR
jgi:hypothetical protein